MADPLEELPLHAGFEPSQPDPPQWATLTRVPPPAPGLRRAHPEALALGGPAPAPSVTVASLSDLLQTQPSVKDILEFLQLPEVVHSTLVEDLGLSDLDTLLASLSDLPDLIKACSDQGLADLQRPFVKFWLTMLDRAAILERPAEESASAAPSHPPMSS